ncbi:MAG: Gfo/Idh/MocA family oxidoreductase [Planctomycetota bacterium]|nr:Gfo/Idh/MocA family oxidoreductase [Planctomycetota bacterium]
MDRRSFLSTTAALSAATLATLQTRAFAAEDNKPHRVALIGSGWYGKTDLFHLMQVAPVEVVGLCDVDQRMLDGAADIVAKRQPSGKRPPGYKDYRKLLEEQKPEIAIIGTPDHWHALPMIAACKAGADVYVQKPISVDVVEGAAMVAAARKYNRTVQVGLQRRSAPHLAHVRKQFIDSGKLGKVGYVDVHSYYPVRDNFPPAAPPPKELDWDFFVGPAQWVDYFPGIQPRAWRDRTEFSNGQIGDLCVHMFDVVRYFLKLGWPSRISAVGGAYQHAKDSRVNIVDTQNALFEYPETQVVWTQRSWGTPGDPDYPWAAFLYGDKGTLKMSVFKYEFIPKDGGQREHGTWFDEQAKYPEDAEHQETEPFAASSTRRHMLDFLAARKEKRKPVADIEEGHISSACCILANLSMDLGRDIQWDPQAAKIKNDDEANARLARKYREPWVHPTPEDV